MSDNGTATWETRGFTLSDRTIHKITRHKNNLGGDTYTYFRDKVIDSYDENLTYESTDERFSEFTVVVLDERQKLRLIKVESYNHKGERFSSKEQQFATDSYNLLAQLRARSIVGLYENHVSKSKGGASERTK